MPERRSPRAARAMEVSPWFLPGRDVGLVIGITAVSAVLAAHFELNEMLFGFTRRYEHLQLDEWPIALFVLAVCLGWLSRLRYRQALVELHARQRAEARLEGVLAENRELAHQHLRIQEAERKHLARELHDELGQYLNAIKLDAVSIAEAAPVAAEGVRAADPGPAGRDAASAPVRAVERIVQAVNHVHTVVSEMIRRLRPAGLDELGLSAALESCVDHWQQRLPGARFSLAVSGELEGLSELANLTLYRLTQEGLTNSYKHAGASHIDVSLRRESTPSGVDDVVLAVADDGRGVDPAHRGPGFGLSGMRERVELLGGRFSIDSAPGRGFSFEARLPVRAGNE